MTSFQNNQAGITTDGKGLMNGDFISVSADYSNLNQNLKAVSKQYSQQKKSSSGGNMTNTVL